MLPDVRGWQRKRTHWALFLALVRSLSPAATNSLAALIQHNHIDFPISNLMFRASQPPTLSWLTCAQTAEPGCWIIQSEIFLFPVTSFIRRRLWRPTPSLGPLCVVCSVLQSSAQWKNVGAQPEMWVIAILGSTSQEGSLAPYLSSRIKNLRRTLKTNSETLACSVLCALSCSPMHSGKMWGSARNVGLAHFLVLVFGPVHLLRRQSSSLLLLL